MMIPIGSCGGFHVNTAYAEVIVITSGGSTSPGTKIHKIKSQIRSCHKSIKPRTKTFTASLIAGASLRTKSA